MVAEGSSKVKVAVRVRPLNKREIECGTDIVIDMQDDQTHLKAPKNEAKKSVKTFTFDHCFWSMDESNEDKFASQEYVYQCLGTDVLANGFNGYNACIFAYGQTGSGKSYTMMGSPNQRGLIPRICDELFERINKNEDENLSYKVEVSYMEIYNEKVRDLLCPKSDKHNLKVREHNILGPYVDGLSSLVVNSFNDIETLMSEGNKSRTVAATMMNAESSRSHAVFNVTMTQSQFDEAMQATGERVSKLSLVDLAGSERASKTGAAGDRLKEGSNINKSLTTLGLVISALADQASGKQKKNNFVPYRDSVLTWLLKDNLGGNSKTVMVATISPSGDNYEETLSTLRYADRAKRIENHAIVNEDPNAKLIRELREEIEQLRSLLTERGLRSNKASLQEQLQESEKLMHQASLTWEEKEKQTEQIHKERHRMLEKMGISIQDSGIAVEKNRYYLVNLNADPTLNELLVYYLQEHNRIGRQDAPVPQDIQLTGLGILPEHCIIDIEDETAYLLPLINARTCVNGQVVTDRTQLRHGDRILWGNNHFFRINCPHAVIHSGPEAVEEKIDFDFAHNELMLNEFDSLGEPIQVIIQKLEENHEKEKQGALDKQKEMYEQKLEELRKEKTSTLLAPAETPPIDGRNSSGYVSTLSSLSDDRLLGTPSSFYDRELAYEESIRRLREEVIRANVLVREANQLGTEMKKDVDFAVTLQIPTASLSQGMSQGPLTSEVAVVVKHRSRGNQVWSVDKLSNKIFDMRDAYQTMIESHPLQVAGRAEENDDGLFFEVECHTLIGVATVWLECLYQNVPLDYSAPIISQQGEVCGRLSVEIKRIQEEGSSVSGDGSYDDGDDDREGLALGSTVQVQITVKEAIGLPLTLCNYVFCQYNFFDQPLTVVPPLNTATSPMTAKANAMPFENTKVFRVDVDDELLDYVTDGSLAIEVYGNRSRGFDAVATANANWHTLTNEEGEEKSLADSGDNASVPVPVKARSMSDRTRWRDLSRRLEMWVEIHELNEQGFYSPVELLQREGQESGGVFMLRQGFSRRIVVQFVVPKVGNLPVVVESIPNMAVGSVSIKMKNQKGLDSYQERDLQTLRDRFSNSVMKRREYLDQQIQEMINRPNKTQVDKEHEGMLIDQWVSLTEERNSILCPVSGSGVPGAVMPDWTPLPGMEEHIPIIFLDLDENALSGCADIEAEPAGSRSFLPMEQAQNILELPLLKYDQKRVTATASWDSSIHDSLYLNRVTPNHERVYLILKVVVRLSSPALVNVVLRKRLCVRIYKRPSIKDSLRKKFWRQSNTPTRCGLTFELISHIPRQSGELSEERESLARKAAMAMHGDGEELMDGEAIEKYNKGISHVENILNLHKLRQEVLVKEKLAAVGRSSKSLTARNMRKYASTPNLFNAPSLSNLWKASNAFPSNSDMTAADGAPPPETNRQANVEARPAMLRNSIGGEGVRNKRLRSQITENRHSFYGFENLDVSPRLKLQPVGDAERADARVEGRMSFQNASPHLRSRGEAIPKNNGVSQLHPLAEDDAPASPVSPLVPPSEIDNFNLRRSLNTEFTGASSTLARPALPLSIFPNDLEETRKLERTRSLRGQELSRQMGLTLDEQGVKEDLSFTNPEDVVPHEEALSRRDNIPTESSSSPRSALRVGDVVSLGDGKQGQVRFYGRTQFADGIWVGMELSTPEGKNDGSVMGVQYFNCRPSHGLFIRADKLAKPDS